MIYYQIVAGNRQSQIETSDIRIAAAFCGTNPIVIEDAVTQKTAPKNWARAFTTPKGIFFVRAVEE